MQKKRKRELLEALAEIGVFDAELEETNSSHIRITFTYKKVPIMQIASGSPSDWRANLKLKCDLKRRMREIDAELTRSP